ncbi:MAG: DUF4143 domain-containing protein, partial [Synergistaceae bacterium]|nr:DUF4143 domain-containing protein [Synergistaceae bacterium]
GLASYLTGWSSPDVLQRGAASGAFFETFVISEIIKSYYNAGVLQLPLYYYRDKDGNEIDLLVYQNMTLYPIEIKKHSSPRRDDVKSFALLDKFTGVERGEGCVLSLYENALPLGEKETAIPLSYL